MKKNNTRKISKFFSFIIFLALIYSSTTGCGTNSYPLIINLEPGNGGTILASPMPDDNGRYKQGTLVKLEARPASGYKFDSWSGDASGTVTSCTIRIDRDKVVYARFISDNGSTTMGATTVTKTITTTVATTLPEQITTTTQTSTITTTKTSTITSTITATVSTAITTAVTSSPQSNRFSLTTSANPSGSGVISPSSGTYDAGTKITLTVQPQFPYAFSSWSGTNDNKANPTTVNLNSDVSVIANLIELKRGIDISSTQPSTKFDLLTGQWVWFEFTIGGPDLAEFSIIDAAGKTMRPYQKTNHIIDTFQAQISGRYSFYVSPISIGIPKYNTTYAIYS